LQTEKWGKKHLRRKLKMPKGPGLFTRGVQKEPS